MGDRFNTNGRVRTSGARTILRRGKPPAAILRWGLGQPASIGHNNGPPLDEEPPGYLWRRYRWNKAHAAAWKTPSMAVLKFRLSRAAAAGMSYQAYTSTLLDTGRFSQARDRDAARTAALGRVRAAWADVVPRIAPSAARMQSAIILSSLTAAYDDASRTYHNLVHVAAVLDDLDRYGDAMIDRDAVVMAALLHDAIYDATRSDNETASARLARLHLDDLGCNADRVEAIARMIEATRHTEADVANADTDTALLLDCDLAILAAPRDRYLAYATAIRREYAHVPEESFRTGRRRVLAAFLARPKLYATPAFAAAWEARARANLAAEIAALTASA
jgi:predicted metal-dependent HD superfamily phosphohydrolase